MREQHSFGYWLRLKRKALDLTREALADRVGCSVSMIRKLEDEERHPSAQIAELLAEIFKIPPTERTAFLQFARGDWRSAPNLGDEEAPWREPQLATQTQSSKLPTGTVTFLYTDIEGSTQLWKQHHKAMAAAHDRHDQILREAIESNKGYVFQVVGDSFCAAFPTAVDAVRAAVESQIALDSEKWGETTIHVRMGIHTGKAEVQEDGRYGGFVTLSHVQRLMSVAHGGQVLLSFTSRELVQDEWPENVELRAMGQRQLKDWSRPEHIFQLVISGLRADFPPLSTPESFPHNLPIQLTSFIGREHEKTEIKALLNSTRLITLTGSGGTGKTRLALEVGAEELSWFANGVWLIELAPLSDESQIIPALAQVFSLQELPFNPLAKLVEDYLRDKKLLLILDNCEHLIAACARLADHLLHQCAGLKILASSREALGIVGEVAYRTPSLRDSESTQLFVERAHAANSNFKVTEANRSAVAQICHRLDGIPLAIELAAARTKLLSAEQIASRLDDVFRLLVGGSRTTLPRQQTLHALIDWSYDLLSDEEKRHLQFASVFVGGWTLEALEFVANDPNTLDLLAQLVNKSLVVTEEREGEMRYFMLETIRQYGREKLFEAKQASAARDRHFIHYKNISSGLWDFLYTASEVETQRVKSIQVELENLRAAFEWGLQNHVQDALDLAANMAMTMSMIGGQIEAITNLKLAMEKFRALPPVEGNEKRDRNEIYAHGCVSLGTLLEGKNEIVSSRSVLQEAIAIARELGDKHLLALCLDMYASASAMIKADDTVAAAQEALEIFSEINHSGGMVMAYANLARWESIHGNFQEAEKYVTLMTSIRDNGTVSNQSGFLNMGIGMGARAQGKFDLARRYFEESLRVFKQIGHKGMTAILTSEIAHTQRAMGNYNEARKTYQETIKVFQEYGNRPAVAHQLECFAMIAIVEEEPQRAAQLFAAAEALRETTGHKRTDEEEVEYVQFMSRLHLMLSETEFNEFWVEGKSMPIEQAVWLATS